VIEGDHALLVEAVLSVCAQYGLALAGGYAIKAHGLVTRPSDDVDFATGHSAPVEEITEALAEAYRHADFEVHVLRASQLELLRDLEDKHLVRLCRARVKFDPRDEEEITEQLRGRLRQYRNEASAGLGEQSAGLLIGYLVSEVFRRAADAAEATMLVARFRELLLADGATVARALGRRDWGVVVGPCPRHPKFAARTCWPRYRTPFRSRPPVSPSRTVVSPGCRALGRRASRPVTCLREPTSTT
jgi:hypothetical protein